MNRKMAKMASENQRFATVSAHVDGDSEAVTNNEIPQIELGRGSIAATFEKKNWFTRGR